MLKVNIELWPYGDESKKKLIGTAIIGNDGSGTPSTGNYRAAISKRYPHISQIWKRARYMGFPRKKRNAWDLLYLILKEAVGDRNK